MTTTTRMNRGQFWGIWGGLGGGGFFAILGPWYHAWQSGALVDLIRVLSLSSLVLLALILQAGAICTIAARFMKQNNAFCALNGAIWTTCGVLILVLGEWTLPQLMANPEFRTYSQISKMGTWNSLFWFASGQILSGIVCWAVVLKRVHVEAGEISAPVNIQGSPA